MPVQIQNTPNPNAMKFTVGSSVGQARTCTSKTGDPLGDELLDVPAVTSVFMTADFVTVSKSFEGDWSLIVPEVTEILERYFG